MSNIVQLQAVAVDLENEIPTLETVVDAYLSQYNGTDPSREQRLREWVPLLGHLRLDQITRQHVVVGLKRIEASPARFYAGKDINGEAIWKKRGNGVRSGATVNKFLVALQGLMRFCRNEGFVPDEFVSPAKGIPKRKEDPGRVRFLTDEERVALLQACRNSKWNRLWLLTAMGLTTGGRLSELMGLRWKDLDLDRGEGRLSSTKNGDRRTLIFVAEVLDELRLFAPKDHATSTGLVFQSKHRPTVPMSFRRYWDAALDESGVKNFRFHDLRHSCASLLAQNEVSLLEIAETLGHRTMAMVRRYSHLSVESRRKTVTRVMDGVL